MAVSEVERLQIYNGFMQRPLSNGPNCPFWCNGCVTTVAAGQRQRADTWYPTSILRPAHRHTVMSTARSGVRGTKRSERPATVACYTVLCYARLYMVMAPPPISTQLTAYTYMYRRTCANARVVSHVSSTCAAINVYIFTGN